MDISNTFNDNKCMNPSAHDKELLKNTIKYGIRLVIYQKNDFIVNQCMMINTLKLR